MNSDTVCSCLIQSISDSKDYLNSWWALKLFATMWHFRLHTLPETILTMADHNRSSFDNVSSNVNFDRVIIVIVIAILIVIVIVIMEISKTDNHHQIRHGIMMFIESTSHIERHDYVRLCHFAVVTHHWDLIRKHIWCQLSHFRET
jgi:hypothetical protein